MLSWRRCLGTVGALYFALTIASPSSAQSGGDTAQSGIVIFWNAAKCIGGYHSDFYSAHCDPGPSATILDFRTKNQFFCVDTEAVEIRWAIPTDAYRGSPPPGGQDRLASGMLERAAEIGRWSKYGDPHTAV